MKNQSVKSFDITSTRIKFRLRKRTFICICRYWQIMWIPFTQNYKQSHGVITLLSPPSWANSQSPLPYRSSIHKLPTEDVGPRTLKRSKFSDHWQRYRYYIYNEYFVNKLNTLSLYQKSFINNVVNKIKCMYL